MRIISTSYSKSAEFSNPGEWLKRISFYSGILEQLSKDNEVISIERINYEGDHNQNGVHYHFIYQRWKTSYFPFKQHRLIKQLQPDVILVNGLIFPLQVIQLRLRAGRKTKIILLHRGEKPFRGLKRYLQKLADKFVDAYLFTSSEFGKEWKSNIDLKKIFEVVQASSVFYPIKKSDAQRKTFVDGSPVFLWVGRLMPVKDPLTVVKAFLEFVIHQPSARLYMIYQSDELLNEIRKILDKHSLHGNSIKLIGAVSHHELLYWYNSADFFISGSHHEGSGVALMEAMSCGCIPVVTDIISFRRITAEGKCGMIYNIGNKRKLLSVLLKTKEINIEMEKQKILLHFQNELSFEAVARKIQDVISSL